MSTNKVAKYDHPGRPLKYTSADDMQRDIDKYFMDCEGSLLLDDDGKAVMNKYGEPVYIGKKPPTVTGLALALGFMSRHSLISYSNKDEFLHTINNAKLRCQQYAESRLYDRDGANGAKFSLQNNFQWADRSEVINTNNNNNTGGFDLSGLTMDELRQLMTITTNKLIEADYTETDE